MIAKLRNRRNGKPSAPRCNPHTAEEWRLASAIGEMLLAVNKFARLWRMVDDQGGTNVARCEQIIGRANKLGIESKLLSRR
jgi:hypothetical protein